MSIPADLTEAVTLVDNALESINDTAESGRDPLGASERYKMREDLQAIRAFLMYKLTSGDE